MVLHWSLREQHFIFVAVLYIFVLATHSKRVKVLYGPQKITIDNYFLLSIPKEEGGPENPSIPIGVNAFRTTNFRSSSAMRGTKFHGNTYRDGPTRILIIEMKSNYTFLKS